MKFPNYKALELALQGKLSEQAFNSLTIKIYKIQHQRIPIYRDYVNSLPNRFQHPKHYSEIPFLPIQFFKSHKVIDPAIDSEITFYSSGTTGVIPSRHFVSNRSWYEKVYSKTFNRFYGNPNEYCILALLPSYLDRKGSSLVEMANGLINQSDHSQSGFYLDEFDNLYRVLLDLKSRKQKTILIGVTFGLLDFIEKFQINFSELIVMETGGMKGRRKELLREEVHTLLKSGFGVDHIHSEYGMTELLSQAYSTGEGIFYTPPQMKVLIRDINDPFTILNSGQSGGINIIDLGNLYSCSFIATQDLGKTTIDGSFEVLGRFDNSDVRGCNLMMG
jgi:hypothetical protein